MATKTPTRPVRDLVLVGGGHSHVQVVRRFAMEPPPDTRMTVVVDRPVAVYSGMVPGFVAGQYQASELEIDVVPLARRAGARVVLSAAVRIDADERRVHFADRPSIRYDVASVDVGSTVAGLDLPGIREHAMPTRPIVDLVRRVDELVARVAERPPGSPFSVVVVGGGAGGVELAFTLWERLGAREDNAIQITLAHALDDVLAGYPSRLITRVHRNAAERDIRIVPGKRVSAAEPARVLFEDDTAMDYDALIWVTGAVSHPLFVDSGLPTEPRGFVRTRATLQVVGHDDLFAVGDCATLDDYPRTPKAGVYAVRQGPYLIDNLRAALRGRSLKTYRPQSDFLTLLNLGDGTALGAKSGLSIEGRWVMSLKDWIDRRFMAKFQVLQPDGRLTSEFERLPNMAAEMAMLCGGCAAKIGQSVLDRALERLPERPRDDTVRLGLDVPDDASAYETPGGDVVVSSLDAFRAFGDDPYLVGRVAAVNAVSDLYATGADPRYALALVALPSDASDVESEELLYQVLCGARAVFDAEGVTLVGGHTTTATELLVGFSIDGFPEGELMSIDGLREGDRLVLTKPLGTGVLLHADMEGRVSGPVLKSTLESMVVTNRSSAAVLRELDASALTDVTGFGLAGHLAEMLRASGRSAVVELDSLPALDGAVSLLTRGERSTFHPENEKAKKGLVFDDAARSHPKLELLFDPQTSGGLLAGIAESRIAELSERLPGAVVIGVVRAPRDDGAPFEVLGRAPDHSPLR